MKVVKWVLIGLVSLVVLIVAIGFLASRTSHIERSRVMSAPRSVVYDQVNIMANWAAWSPWDHLDTNMKKTLTGPPSGVGSGYTWTSDDWKVGDGKLEVVEADANHIVANMNFGASERPSKATFTFSDDGKGTKVTWILDSDYGMNPFARFMGMFMDGMVGPMFEKGLASIDSIAKTLPPPVAVHEELFQGGSALTMRVQCPISEIGSKLALIYGTILKSAGEQHVSMIAPPFAIYHQFDQAHGKVDMEAGMQFPSLPKATAPVQAVQLAPGKVIVADYYGPYQGSGAAWTAIERYATDHRLVLDGSPWESYVTDPMSTPDSTKWLTRVYYRVK
jgi:effector-binding domain-containing protein